jgi:hypothetical protein
VHFARYGKVVESHNRCDCCGCCLRELGWMRTQSNSAFEFGRTIQLRAIQDKRY